MSGLFITLLNMSFMASYVAVIVIVIRYVLAKCRVPKIFSYALWAVVLFRLVFPFSFESAFSLIPGKTNAISQNMLYSESPAIDSGITLVDITVNNSIQATFPPVDFADSVNPMQVILEFGAFIWMLGVAILIIYVLISYVRLKRRLIFATRRTGNIYETDQIKTPFVLGFIKPRIYLPIGLAEQDIDFIIKHEQTHIRRYDHLIKPLSYLIVTLHWFNPLMWLSYFLMNKDMEMSCDERVMKESNDDARSKYSRTLLALGSKQSGLLLLGPLSFGESHVKSRVRNILNCKRPAFWVGIVTIVVVVTLAIGLLVNPITNKENDVQSLAGYIVMEENTLYLDEVEVITTEDVDRIAGLNLHDPGRMAELDLNEEEMPNGYYIHNLSTDRVSFELTDETSYTFTDYNLLFIEDADGDRLHTTTKKEDIIQHLNTSFINTPFTGRVPYPVFIEVKDGKVISITEKFIFTQ